MELKYPRLDLGCGLKKLDHYVGIDMGGFAKDYPEDQFIQYDVFGFIEGVEDEVIEKIYAKGA